MTAKGTNLASKIGIGTAQFGMDYGINNETGMVSAQEVLRILQMAIDHGVQVIDTARAYGSSEQALSQAFAQLTPTTFKVISKVPPGTHPKDLMTACADSLDRIGLPSFYGLLFHRFDDFKRDAVLALEGFHRLVNEGHLNRFGVSIYAPSELEWLLEKGLYPACFKFPTQL